MKDLPSLLALFYELDRHLDAARAVAEQQGDKLGSKQAEEKQRLNEQAYFVICWGQLEVEIDEACRTAIRKGQLRERWEQRRVWDLYNPDDKRLSGLAFEERAALVLDKRGGRGSPWARVVGYYALRNQIAHGTVRSERIDVTSVAADFYAIQAAVAR